LSHSHLPVQHLIKRMETWQPGQGGDRRPDWLTKLIEETAEMFEPLTGVARVGFECHREEDCWVARLYLGSTEVVGGARDGQMKPMSFEVDIEQLLAKFTEREEFCWSVFPAGAEDIDDPQSYLTISGLVAENRVRLHLFATPSEETGPGLKVFPDGRFELA
jgi:hypothetical protein